MPETGEKMKNRYLKVLGILATIGIFVVILAGVVVTRTGSGDGCGPNWPLCHGKLFPDNPTFETVVEYTHRLVTGIVGLLVISFTIIAAYVFRKNKEVIFAAVGSLFFLILQSALGALAVVFGQSAAVMALHFGFSLLSYAFVFILTVFVFHLSRRNQLPTAPFSSGLKWAVLGLFILSYVVVYLGALVTHTSAQGGCVGWPLCNGRLIPAEWTTITIIHFVHRLSALLLLLATALLMWRAKQLNWEQTLFYRIAQGLFLMVIAQVLSGGLLVYTNFNLYAGIFHTFFITLMFGLLCYTVLYAFRRHHA